MTLAVPAATFEGYETNLTNPGATVGTNVAAPPSTHTKNTTYTTLIAATAADSYGILLAFADCGASAIVTSSLCDIALGAASSEVVLIPNLNCGYAAPSTINNGTGGQKYYFPVYIPSGSRVSATLQSAVASQTVNVAVWLYEKPRYAVWTGSKVTDYGTVAASSRGTVMVSGLSGVEGAWTQITAATTDSHYFMSAGISSAGDSSTVTTNIYVDVGMGAAASEIALSENNVFQGTAGETLLQMMPISMYQSVASGSRLAGRVSQSSGSAQSYDMIVYGVT